MLITGDLAVRAAGPVRIVCGMTRLKRVEVELDDDLVQEVLRRYGLGTTREAIHLALRTLLGESPEPAQQDEEYDEFSDLSAWVPKRSGSAQ